jgi:hypothetical protein
VAEYLESLPGAGSLRVAAADRPGRHLEQYFRGQRVAHGTESDYLLFDVAGLQRRIRPQEWEAAWEEARHRVPELVVRYDGVAVFWLFAANPSGALSPTEVRRGWNGWVVVAWLWTAALAACVGWAVRARPHLAADEEQGVAPLPATR